MSYRIVEIADSRFATTPIFRAGVTRIARGSTFILLWLLASPASAQTFTNLFSFTGGTGNHPFGDSTLSGTTLYGMTYGIGDTDSSQLFSVGINGSGFQDLLVPGGEADGNLTLGGTTLYGVTPLGSNLFSVGTNGSGFKNLVNFTGTSGTAIGSQPYGNLTLSGTALFGVTGQGGSSRDGNVYSVGTNGSGFQNLLSFTGTGGAYPGINPTYGLTLSGTTLYGMTDQGGSSGDGEIFSVSTNGSGFQTLLSFTGTGGAFPGRFPVGSLTLIGTTLYGVIQQGGSSDDGEIFSVGTNGSGFQNLLSFTGTGGAYPGINPTGLLTLSGTTFYGMTEQGGGTGYGNVFSVGTDGSDFQSLLAFTGSGGEYTGEFPEGGLTLNGSTLYGLTSEGGASGDGNAFSLTINTSPEPSTFALLLAAGAIGLLGYGWRRRASRTAKQVDVECHAPRILAFPSDASTAIAARKAA